MTSSGKNCNNFLLRHLKKNLFAIYFCLVLTLLLSFKTTKRGKNSRCHWLRCPFLKTELLLRHNWRRNICESAKSIPADLHRLQNTEKQVWCVSWQEKQRPRKTAGVFRSMIDFSYETLDSGILGCTCLLLPNALLSESWTLASSLCSLAAVVFPLVTYVSSALWPFSLTPFYTPLPVWFYRPAVYESTFV